MKNIILLVLATIILNSCQKDDDYHYQFPEDEIIFPNEGIYGLNVLNETTTKFKTYDNSVEGPWYSLMASVPINNSLKIILEDTSPNKEDHT